MRYAFFKDWLQEKNKRNPVIKKMINGMAWNVFGTAISNILMMFASIATARILGVDQNGEYGVINSTVFMFSTFAGLGLGITATRFVAEYKTTDIEKCGRIIGMTNIVGIAAGCSMAIILFILAPWLASEQLNAPYLQVGLRVASVLLITNTINTIQYSVLAGFENFKGIAKLAIIQGLVAFPSYIGFTVFFGVNGLILGQVAVSSIMVMLFEIETIKTGQQHAICRDIRNANQEFDVMWRFSLPSMLSNLMIGPVIWIGNTFITATTNGYFELGIFNAANQWRTVLTFFPIAVGRVIQPLIVANRDNCRLERINILFGWMIVSCFAIPVLAAPELITWLYGKEYSGQALKVSLLIIVLICCIISYKEGVARNLVSNNLMWWGFLSNSLWGITFLGLLWSIRGWGAIGISVSHLGAYFVTTLVFIPFYISRKVVHSSLIISKEVLFMWVALLIQMSGTVLTENVAIRFATAAISITALWHVGKMMIKSSKFD
jgi:O-antigen/teichoic acid export membrane protein